MVEDLNHLIVSCAQDRKCRPAFVAVVYDTDLNSDSKAYRRQYQ